MCRVGAVHRTVSFWYGKMRMKLAISDMEVCERKLKTQRDVTTTHSTRKKGERSLQINGPDQGAGSDGKARLSF